jgi:uncharacterized protein YqjF (DUF2071 family)
MHQRWRHLLFMHWRVSPETLRPLIPSELDIDLFDGNAYAGLVPFTMHGIRPVFAPPPPGLSAFHETNVRTYVRPRNGRGDPGVWFFSLDAANTAAVIGARVAYKLPYFRASMSMAVSEQDHMTYVSYSSERFWPEPIPARCRLGYTVMGPVYQADEDPLDRFLIERYTLYSSRRNALFRARVHHAPYTLRYARVTDLSETLIKAAGIERPDDPPMVHYSPGVDVTVEALRRMPS